MPLLHIWSRISNEHRGYNGQNPLTLCVKRSWSLCNKNAIKNWSCLMIAMTRGHMSKVTKEVTVKLDDGVSFTVIFQSTDPIEVFEKKLNALYATIKGPT